MLQWKVLLHKHFVTHFSSAQHQISIGPENFHHNPREWYFHRQEHIPGQNRNVITLIQSDFSSFSISIRFFRSPRVSTLSPISPKCIQHKVLPFKSMLTSNNPHSPSDTVGNEDDDDSSDAVLLNSLFCINPQSTNNDDAHLIGNLFHIAPADEQTNKQANRKTHHQRKYIEVEKLKKKKNQKLKWCLVVLLLNNQ